MIKSYFSKRLINYARRFLSKVVIYQKDDSIDLVKKSSSDFEKLSIRDIILCDFRKADTKLLTDVVYTFSDKFEDEVLNYVDINYDVVRSESFQMIFLSLIAKAHFLKHDQMIPMLRCYDVSGCDLFDKQCWEIIGRILNNCMNFYSDNNLIELCFHLLRIKTIPHRIEELKIFWKRIEIQKENWLTRLDKLDAVALVHLLEISAIVDLGGDVVFKVLEAIKNSDDFFYRLIDLPVISLLVDVMDRNNIIDIEILSESLTLLPMIDEKVLLKSVSFGEFVGLIWNYGNMALKSELAREVLRGINLPNLVTLNNDIVRHNNDKLYLKMSRSLYLLGLDINMIIMPDLEPSQCHDIFEKDIQNALFTLQLVKNHLTFVEKYGIDSFDKIELPRSIKLFYMLMHIDLSTKNDLVIEYLDQVSSLAAKLSENFTVIDSDKSVLIIEHFGIKFGIIPCHSMDNVYQDASNYYLNYIHQIYPDISFYKICFEDWRDITVEEVVKRVLDVIDCQIVTSIK